MQWKLTKKIVSLHSVIALNNSLTALSFIHLQTNNTKIQITLCTSTQLHAQAALKEKAKDLDQLRADNVALKMKVTKMKALMENPGSIPEVRNMDYGCCFYFFFSFTN